MSGDTAGWLVALVVLALVAAVGSWGWTSFKDAQAHGKWLMWRDCPFGTELAGKHPPDGTEEWCQQEAEDGSYRRHGPSRSWYANGQIMNQGSYIAGHKEGMWKSWNHGGSLDESTFYAPNGRRLLSEKIRSGATHKLEIRAGKTAHMATFDRKGMLVALTRRLEDGDSIAIHCRNGVVKSWVGYFTPKGEAERRHVLVGRDTMTDPSRSDESQRSWTGLFKDTDWWCAQNLQSFRKEHRWNEIVRRRLSAGAPKLPPFRRLKKVQ
ncbi:MAG: hypothetical protein MJD61_20020 [Proteobacteria bacterium]|nr:hypothetical protein [Pseudomonadota bacterium]